MLEENVKYELRADDRDVAASSEFNDNFAAEKWARKWAETSAQHDDYVLRRDDGKYVSRLFRTHAGQWYFMPLSTELNPAGQPSFSVAA
jgi:hypothetical protein